MQSRYEPVAERPDFPGYGIEQSADGMLSWEHVCERMTSARNYWICTARADGRPHAAPVWGVWMDDAFYFSTGPRSVKGRNLARDPRITVNLESGDDCVIFEGEVEMIDTPDPARFARFADAYAVKYDFRPAADNPDGGLYVLRPRVAFAWLEQDYPKTATRWRFPDA